MLTVRTVIISSFALAAGLGGCGKAKSSAAPHPGIVLPDPGKDSFALTADQMKGYWVSACARPSSGMFGLDYARHQIFFDGTTFVSTTAAFADAGCADAGLEKLLIISGTYAFAGTALKASTPVDFTIEDVSMIALSDSAAAHMNAFDGTCAIKDWKSLEVRPVKDVAGCDYLYTASFVPFNIAAMVGDSLSLGDYYSSETIGRTADSRPTSLAVGEELAKSDKSVLGEIGGSGGTSDGTGDGTGDGGDAGGDGGTQDPVVLALSDISGSWNGTAASLVRGTSTPIAPGQARFRFSSDATTFAADYSICQGAVSCSGGDVYAHIRGTTAAGKFKISCTQSGVSREVEVGEVLGAKLKIQAPSGFGNACPTGKDWIEIEKTSDGSYRMTAVADNFGEVIAGTATLVR